MAAPSDRKDAVGQSIAKENPDSSNILKLTIVSAFYPRAASSSKSIAFKVTVEDDAGSSNGSSTKLQQSPFLKIKPAGKTVYDFDVSATCISNCPKVSISAHCPGFLGIGTRRSSGDGHSPQPRGRLHPRLLEISFLILHLPPERLLAEERHRLAASRQRAEEAEQRLHSTLRTLYNKYRESVSSAKKAGDHSAEGGGSVGQNILLAAEVFHRKMAQVLTAASGQKRDDGSKNGNAGGRGSRMEHQKLYNHSNFFKEHAYGDEWAEVFMNDILVAFKGLPDGQFSQKQIVRWLMLISKFQNTWSKHGSSKMEDMVRVLQPPLVKAFCDTSKEILADVSERIIAVNAKDASEEQKEDKNGRILTNGPRDFFTLLNRTLENVVPYVGGMAVVELATMVAEVINNFVVLYCKWLEGYLVVDGSNGNGDDNVIDANTNKSDKGASLSMDDFGNNDANGDNDGGSQRSARGSNVVWVQPLGINPSSDAPLLLIQGQSVGEDALCGIIGSCERNRIAKLSSASSSSSSSSGAERQRQQDIGINQHIEAKWKIVRNVFQTLCLKASEALGFYTATTIALDAFEGLFTPKWATTELTELETPRIAARQLIERLFERYCMRLSHAAQRKKVAIDALRSGLDKDTFWLRKCIENDGLLNKWLSRGDLNESLKPFYALAKCLQDQSGSTKKKKIMIGEIDWLRPLYAALGSSAARQIHRNAFPSSSSSTTLPTMPIDDDGPPTGAFERYKPGSQHKRLILAAKLIGFYYAQNEDRRFPGYEILNVCFREGNVRMEKKGYVSTKAQVAPFIVTAAQKLLRSSDDDVDARGRSAGGGGSSSSSSNQNNSNLKEEEKGLKNAKQERADVHEGEHRDDTIEVISLEDLLAETDDGAGGGSSSTGTGTRNQEAGEKATNGDDLPPGAINASTAATTNLKAKNDDDTDEGPAANSVLPDDDKTASDVKRRLVEMNDTLRQQIIPKAPSSSSPSSLSSSSSSLNPFGDSLRKAKRQHEKQQQQHTAMTTKAATSRAATNSGSSSSNGGSSGRRNHSNNGSVASTSTSTSNPFGPVSRRGKAAGGGGGRSQKQQQARKKPTRLFGDAKRRKPTVRRRRPRKTNFSPASFFMKPEKKKSKNPFARELQVAASNPFSPHNPFSSALLCDETKHEAKQRRHPSQRRLFAETNPFAASGSPPAAAAATASVAAREDVKNGAGDREAGSSGSFKI
eukprot:jgi/Bigna1/78278/fgenesh1_pg.53_\